VRSYWGGDHSLFLGQVEYARYGEGRPLLFHGGRYEKLEAPDQPGVLPAALLTPLLAVGSEVEFADGATMMQIGASGDQVLVVLDGAVRVDRPGISVTLGPGHLIGEIEVLDPGGGRTAYITAVGAVRCVSVTGDQLRTVLETDPGAALAMIEILASRFRDKP
jgi:CRP-like cAMP-binding protein